MGRRYRRWRPYYRRTVRQEPRQDILGRLLAWLLLPLAIWAAVEFLDKDDSKDPASVFGGSPWFSSCADAKAAGYGPMSDGDPGYAPHLDRDGDGIACEWN